MAATSTTNVNQFIAYFEEPEPGVPQGLSGWYHSSGAFPLSNAQDAFHTTGTGVGDSLLKPQIAGPFRAKHHAQADLQSNLSA